MGQRSCSALISRKIVASTVALWLCLTALLATPVSPVQARDAIDIIDNFLVYTDFNRDFRIEPGTKIYFRPIREVDPRARSASTQDNFFLPRFRERLPLSDDRGSSQYLLQARMEKSDNFAVRKNASTPSKGYIMFSICNITITDMKNDCRNTTFYYFKDEDSDSLFSRAFSAWETLLGLSRSGDKLQ